MLQNIELEILHRPLAADKKKRIPVIQHAHLVRCHQLAPRQLPVGGVAAVPAFGLPVCVRIDCLFPEQLGDVLVRGLLVAPEIEKLVAVADDRLPLLFKQRL